MENPVIPNILRKSGYFKGSMFVFYCMNCSILRYSNESMYFRLLLCFLWAHKDFCCFLFLLFFWAQHLRGSRLVFHLLDCQKGAPEMNPSCWEIEHRRSLRRLKSCTGFVQRPPEPSSCQKFTRFREPAGSAQCWGTCGFYVLSLGGWSHIVFFWGFPPFFSFWYL